MSIRIFSKSNFFKSQLYFGLFENLLKQKLSKNCKNYIYLINPKSALENQTVSYNVPAATNQDTPVQLICSILTFFLESLWWLYETHIAYFQEHNVEKCFEYFFRILEAGFLIIHIGLIYVWYIYIYIYTYIYIYIYI